jgi:hypothetical protein
LSIITQKLKDFHFKPKLKQENFELDPLKLIIDDADIAKWNNEGLPNDTISIENATIFTFCKKCPFLIDPQLQGDKKKQYLFKSLNLKLMILKELNG